MLLWFTAFAAPPDFTELKVWNDCTLYKRPKTDTRPSAMRAECTWKDVDPVKLGKMMTDFDRFDDLLWPIDTSEVRRIEGDRSLVYQLQKIWALNDREVLLWARTEQLESGVRASWTTASEEPLTPRSGTIRTPINEGYWEITAAEQGARVIHEIAIDAGGVPLPQWLIRAIQTRGFGRVMDDIHTAAL